MEAVSPQFELGSDGPTALVVGVDGSDTSWRALYFAFGQARRQGGQVVAGYVIPTQVQVEPLLAEAMHDTADEIADELERAVHALGREHGIDTTFVRVAGDPAAALERLVVEHRADALVVGASQAARHKVYGSTPLRAVRRSCCPVVVVP